MTCYEYMNRATGEVIEREYRIGRAPKSVRNNGKRYERILSVPTFRFEDHVNGRGTDFVAESIDPAHHKFHRGRFHKNKHGESKPVFSSRAERDAFRSAAASEGVRYEYGKFRE